MKELWLKLLYYGIPTSIVALTILFLNAAPILQRPWTDTDDVEKAMESTAESAVDREWSEALESVEDLEEAWEQVKRRIALIVPGDRVADLDLELAEFRAAVEARDAGRVLAIHRRLEVLWSGVAQ